MRLPTALASALSVVTLTASLVTAQGRSGQNALRQFIAVDTSIVALTNVRVIDGTGAPARANQTLIIRDGNIAVLGDAARVPVPSGALVMNLTGKSLIPGLVMVHEHLYYPTGGGTYGNYTESFPRLYLAGGVTSMRTGGNTNGYGEIAIKYDIDSGRKVGPWIDATAPYLEGQGAYTGQMYELRDAADARRMVNFWADAGATSFKAYMNITRDQLRAAIEEVHRRGLKITGHLCSVTYREAAELGIDNLEHSFFTATDFVADKQPDQCPGQSNGMQAIHAVDTSGAPFKSLVRTLIDRNVALTSTLTIFETFVPGRPLPPGLDVLTPQLRESFVSRHERQGQQGPNGYSVLYPKVAAMEVSFFRAGGLLVAGTDPTGGGGVIPGFANQRAIELLVEAGLTPLEAIQVCALNGARYLGREARVGSIAVGKQADLVVIDGDPSTRVADVRKVELVFRNGVGYDPERLIASVRGRVGIY
jgi:enamidase